MRRIVSTVPKSRFDKYNVHFPDDWEITYVDVPYTQEQLIQECKDSDYLFVGSIHSVTASVFEKCSHLKMVHVEGVGYDKVDVEAAALHNIPVCNNRAVNNGAVAEHVIGLILAALRRTVLCNEQIYTIGYAACKAEHLTVGQHELAGKTIGFIGMGAVGKEVVKRLQNWDCIFVYNDIYRLTEKEEQSLSLKYAESDEVYSSSDIISLHVPLLDSTYHMVDSKRFSQMKKNAILINTARGEVIDQKALCDALERNHLAAAALDTIYPEPAPEDHVLLRLSKEAKKRLIITPHIAGMTDEAFTRMLTNAIQNFERVERGGEPLNIVNTP